MSILPVQSDYDFHITDIVHVTERQSAPSWRLDRLSNPDYFIVAYCVDGKAFYAFDNKELHAVKGDLLFFPQGLVRSAAVDPDEPWSFHSVAFRIRFADEASRAALEGLDNLVRTPQHFKLLPLFAELNRVWSGKRIGHLIRCRSILMEILYEIIKAQNLLKHGSAHSAAIEKAVSHVLAHYDRPVSIEELAHLSGLSSSHFRLMFKRITGMTSVQFQHYIRINKAKDLLLSGECNVTEAAMAVGFQDIYYFSRLFKKMTGVSPSGFIRS
jgi:AraC-like DNA-binding protein